MYELHVSQADHYVTPLAIGNGTRIAKKGALLVLVRGSMLFKRVPMCVAAVDVAFNQDVKALQVDPSVNSIFLIYQLVANESRIPINETGNIFIWCLFMAICERVIDGLETYAWVKHLYIDDPITSLDDNNAIAVASDLAKLLRKAKSRTRAETVVPDGPGEADNPPRMVPAPIKAVVSSHHSLFFNVVCNELKKDAHKKYLLQRPERGTTYTLRATDDTPFFHHVSMLAELQKVAQGGTLYTYHFNMLRSILEKTATFFGRDDFSACIHGLEDADLFSRALNLLSHGKYDIYQPSEMVDDNKKLFRQILGAFLGRYEFALPDIFEKAAQKKIGATTP